MSYLVGLSVAVAGDRRNRDSTSRLQRCEAGKAFGRLSRAVIRVYRLMSVKELGR